MKKAFEQNVSRAKPRVRLGAMLSTPESETEAPEAEAAAPAPAARVAEPPARRADLGSELRARIDRSRTPRPTASEAVQQALLTPPEPAPAAPAPMTARAEPVEYEVQRPASPLEDEAPAAYDSVARREQLKERLRRVRENPRPEPLPATSAEAGLRAVERIAALQVELGQVKALNLALTQDLEAARRRAEKATEEARIRMDEATRLSSEMETRAKLLSDLERELASLEGERDEALLSLQDTRRELEAQAKEQDALREQVAKKDAELAETLSEEERLATELESAQSELSTARRSLEAAETERTTLARQVAELTAERAELLEARKALEAVHRALSDARA